MPVRGRGKTYDSVSMMYYPPDTPYPEIRLIPGT
jgi:hypothetical protein